MDHSPKHKLIVECLSWIDSLVDESTHYAPPKKTRHLQFWLTKWTVFVRRAKCGTAISLKRWFNKWKDRARRCFLRAFKVKRAYFLKSVSWRNFSLFHSLFQRWRMFKLKTRSSTYSSYSRYFIIKKMNQRLHNYIVFWRVFAARQRRVKFSFLTFWGQYTKLLKVLYPPLLPPQANITFSCSHFDDVLKVCRNQKVVRA